MILPVAFLWFLCALSRLVRGRADRLEGVPDRILVVQMAKLGDMVCTTPVFHAIKKRYPDATVTAMGNAINQELLSGNADIDDYLVFDGIRSAYGRIKGGQFDAAVIVVPDIISAMLAYLAHVPLVIVPRVVGGYSPFESVWYRSLRSIAGLAVEDLRMGVYTPLEYVHLLRPLGIEEDDTTKHLVYSDAAKTKAESLFAGVSGMRVGMSPSAGNKYKNWGPQRFAELAEKISANIPSTIVLFGGTRDQEETRQMKERLPSSVRCLDLSEQLSLDELKAAIAQLDVFIAVDTGPIYLAEAFGVPTVDILGPVAEGEQAPVGEWHVVVPPPGPRIPQMWNMNVHGHDETEMRRQIDSTTVELVYAAALPLLQKIHEKNS
jgi:ADP-heptose:LPS heptosyltransferase